MAKQSWLLDIETYPNWFFVGVKDYKTCEYKSWEISERRNDLGDFVQVFLGYDGFLTTFNGVGYDTVVMKYILKDYDKLKKLPVLKMLERIKHISNQAIESGNKRSPKREQAFDEIKWYLWWKSKKWTDIDLLLYWSSNLRGDTGKKLSLKALAFQLRFDEIQELPYKHDTVLDFAQMDEIIRYNMRNDLGALEKLFDYMKEEISLRKYVLDEYGLPCWSMDAPKIASEYLLDYYCNEMYGDNSNEIKKDVRKRRYSPEPWIIGDYVPEVTFKTPFFQDIYQTLKNHKTGQKFEIKKVFGDYKNPILLSISEGGIHSENNKQYFQESEDIMLLDIDIASLYPTLFEKYRFLRGDLNVILDKYVNVKGDRIAAKREKLKKKDKFLKLILNSFSGLADSSTSWLYSPEHLLALRTFGQLIQLRFIEELSFHGIYAFFTNTDGTCVKCPRNKLAQYYETARLIEKEFEVEWEIAELEKIIFLNTNAYISSIKEAYVLDDDLKKVPLKGRMVKRIGQFKLYADTPLGDSTNEMVIPFAVDNYIVNGIPIEDTIKNPDKYGLTIYDYCVAKKVNRDYSIWWNNEQQQQLNRYYFAKPAPYLYKMKNSKNKLEHMHKGNGVVIFNKFEDKPFEEYKVDFTYYCKKARDIVENLETEIRQTSLF